MIDWLIVGGGIHGTTIANALLGYAPKALIRIVDPEDEPLREWRRRTDACAMRFLRSPAAHTVGASFTGLVGFAKENGYRVDEHTTSPYARPSVELFDAYLDASIDRARLSESWIEGRVTNIATDGISWAAEVDGTSVVEARRLILCVGRGYGGEDASGADTLNTPEWMSQLPGADHVLSARFDRAAMENASMPMVVGAGTTGVHLALHLGRPDRPCTLVVRHPIRVAQFDSDPCYIGPKCMRSFVKERDPERRRALIDGARNPGSIPPDLAQQLAEAERSGAIKVVAASIAHADAVAFATGFTGGPPAETLLRSAAACARPGEEPRRDSAGMPIPGRSLEWMNGLFLTGVLAEQELGPSAPNIIGGQNAAKRIIGHLAGRLASIPTSWRRYGRV